MPDQVTANSSNIASAINAAHAGVEAAKKEGARYAIECGRLLREAKATVPHGGWDVWVRQQCRFSPRTAQLYMRVAEHVGDDPAKAQRVAALSLREAARTVGQVKTGKEMPPEFHAWLDEFTTLWIEVGAKEHRLAADHLRATGLISASQHAAMICGVEREEAAEAVANSGAVNQAFLERLVHAVQSGSTVDQITHALQRRLTSTARH